MDPRLLRAYNDELAYLRDVAREFGEEHEGVAGRLGLKTPTDPDPYVERLLEGVAFLAARVNLKQQDQFPEFTQHLLHAMQPHYLGPMPSICIAGFEPQDGDPALVTGQVVPRQTELVAFATDHDNVPVTFRSGHAVTLWPLRLSQAEFLSSRAAIAAYAAIANVPAECGIRLRFSATAGLTLDKIQPTSLPIYLDGNESVPGELYRQMIGHCVAVIARAPGSAGGRESWIGLPLPRQIGFEQDEALLPDELRSFRGYRLLTEYFACPERFLFVDLPDLAKAFAVCGLDCDVILLFNRSSSILDGAIEPGNFRLYATPAINLFEKQLGRVEVEQHNHEFHVVPDRTRPLDFEIYRLLDVKGFSGDSIDGRTVAPLYAYGALLYDWREALFYTTQLRLRRLSTREQRLRRRTDYVGTETWLSLTAPGNPELLSHVRELAVRALVTNRELPELLTFRGEHHFTVSGAAIRAVSILRSPTKPRPPMGLHDAAWRVIGHLTPNYSSLAPLDNDDPSQLRNHLALYGRQDDERMRQQIDGILSVNSRKISRRVPGLDRTALARGQQITIKLDDASFDRSRLFLFTAVIERFLGEFATVNSFTECQFETPLEGRMVQWPPRAGRRHNI